MLDPLDIEAEKLKIEREKLVLERQKTRWSAVSAIVPVLVGLITIIYGIWSLHRTAEDQLAIQRESATAQMTVKVAEVVLAGGGPQEATARASLIAKLFPEFLPKDFLRRVQQLNPNDFESTSDLLTQARVELFKATIAHPEKQTELLKQWITLYPQDGWLAATSPKKQFVDIQRIRSRK